MPTALPPIPEDSWQEHQGEQYEAGQERLAAAVDAGRAAQERADEAERTAFADRARAQIETALAPAKEAWARRDFAASARSSIEEALAPARRAWASASQARSAGAVAPPPAGTPPAGGRGALRRVYQDALDAGLDDEGARAAVAVAQTEHGYEGALGDQGVSAGTFQLHHAGGMGTEYARSRGFSPEQSIAELRRDPHAANAWALSGYLGNAIREGQRQGLRGPALAEFAQRTGQRSVSPERAGQNYQAAQQALDAEGPQTFPEAVQTSPAPAGGPTTAGPRPRAVALGQFEQGLPYAEAAAICGPVAALAFAQANGRNPDLGEARRLARQVGWTEAGGMNGVANEQRLLQQMGVSSRLDTEPDFGEIAADAASGNPLILSTAVHYYYVDGYDEATGRLHVGKTGEARRGGSAWMTPQQIADLDGGLNGALYVDNPGSTAPSVAAGERRADFDVSTAPDASSGPLSVSDRNQPRSTQAGAPYPPAPDEGPYPGSLPPREPEAPVGGSVEPPTRRQRVRDALENLTDALLGAVDEGPEPTSKLTTSQGPAGRMREEGPYPGSLPTPGYDVNAAARVSPDYLSDLGRTAGSALTGFLPKSPQEAIERVLEDPRTPDVPGLPFAGGLPPFNPAKPVRDPEIERKVLAGETLTAGDFVSALTKAAGHQYESTPASLEGVVPGVHLGRDERSLGRAFAQGLTEGSGPAATARGLVSLAGEAAGGAGRGVGLPGFYSLLRRTVADRMDWRATAGQIRGLLKGAGVKPEEMRWTGFEDFLAQHADRPITKDAALRFLDENAVRVEEVVAGGPYPGLTWRPGSPGTLMAFDALGRRTNVVERLPNGMYRLSNDIRSGAYDTLEEAQAQADRMAKNAYRPETKYGTSSYTLPGGTNYRELRLTLPGRTRPTTLEEFAEKRAVWAPGETPDQVRAAYEADRAAGRLGIAEQTPYHGPHWDEPNVLAHVRFDDRTGDAGEKVLFVQEVQSDMMQAARKHGVRTQKPFAVFDADDRPIAFFDTQEAARDARASVPGGVTYGRVPVETGAVPAAPFEKTWTDLVVKRILGWAAEHGYDRVAWTPGAVHAAETTPSRYGTERLSWAKTADGWDVTAEELVGGPEGIGSRGGLPLQTPVRTLEDLRRLVDPIDQPGAREIAEGRTLADRLWKRMQTQPEGGVMLPRAEGMAEYYGPILSSSFGNAGKPFGARVGTTRIAGPPQSAGLRARVEGNAAGWWVTDDAGADAGPFPTEAAARAALAARGAREARAAQLTVPAIDVTPSMRATLRAEGQRLFAGAPAGAATAYATAEPQQPGESDTDYALRVAGRTAGGAVLFGAAGLASTGRGRAVLRTVGERARRAGLVPGLSVEEVGGPATGGAEREVERLRLDKFPEGVRDLIQRAAEGGEFWRTQRRGVIPDAVAERMADRLRLSVDDVIRRGRVGKALNTEETRAVRNALVAQSVEVAERAAEIAADPTGATPKMLAEQIAAGMKLADLSRVAEGARAEAGRALRAYQSFARDFAADPASAVRRIYGAANLTPEQAALKATEFQKMVADGADAFQMARFWANLERPPVNAGDWFRLLRYNAMLSGPRTALVNVLGNALEVPWRAARDVGASVISGDVRPLRPELEGLGSGVVRGIQNARDVLAHGITEEQALAGDVPRSLSSRLERRVPRAIATALELPGRGMQAADEVARAMGYGMVRGREAGLQASREGLAGDAWRGRVDALLDEGPPSPGAAAAAERMTWKGPMGYLGERSLAPLQRWSPLGVPLGNVVLPFLRTVYHITSRGIERSPIGAVGAGVDVLRGAYGPLTRANLREQLSSRVGPGGGLTPLGERAGDALMGSTAFAGLALYAAQGNVTGKGPSDPDKRRMLQAQGWQPYSVKLGDRYVSYANWGPMAVPLALAAALHEGEGKSTPAYLYDVFERGANLLTEQSYLQGVGAIFKAMDPTRGSTFGEQSLEQFLSTLVPYGAAINTLGQATDPLLRVNEKGDVAGALAGRIPGLRETVPAQQDVLGRPVANPQQGLTSVQPFRVSPERPDPVLTAMLQAGVDVPPPPPTVSPGTGLTVELTPEEQRAYQRSAGEALNRWVGAYLTSEKSRTDPPAQRTARLLAFRDAAREQAALQVLRAMGSEQIRRRSRARAAG